VQEILATLKVAGKHGPILEISKSGTGLSDQRSPITERILEGENMQATLDGHVIAKSDDIVETGGYKYFPAQTVRLEWLEKASKTDSDRACPHGVQFYDVIIDGVRHERNAWSYEAPLPAMQHVGGRFGFWEDVRVD
jgi:uncharacterized protein (DUF427 family)